MSTAFIIESYKALQPDYTQYVANFIYAAATSNTAVNGAFQMLSAVESMGPPDIYVHPSREQRWTNGLWFTSLAVSLTVALLCIMVKQWLDIFTARTKRSAPSLRHWARRHQLYYRGLNAWGVPALISLLPLLLHVSLFLFFASLVLFLQPLDGPIAKTLLGILVSTVVFYVLSIIIPVVRVECPSYTPLLGQAWSVIMFGFGIVLPLLTILTSSCASFIGGDKDRRNSIFSKSRRALLHAVWKLKWKLRELPMRIKAFTRETSPIQGQQYILDGSAITTLLVSTNDTDIIDAGVEAISAIPAEPTIEAVVRDIPEDIIAERTHLNLLTTSPTSAAFAVMTDARRLRTLWILTPTQYTLFSHFRLRFHEPVDLYPFLGLDGVMLQLLAVGWDFPDRGRHMALITSLRGGLLTHLHARLTGGAEAHNSPLGSSPLRLRPNRAVCLLFLSMIQQLRPILWQHTMACAMLTFCAGNFEDAAQNEQSLALRTLLAFIKREPNVAASSEHAEDSALDALDSLLAVLFTREEYQADDNTNRLLVHHLGLLSGSIARSRRPRPTRWAQLSGLATFVQSPDFDLHVYPRGLHDFGQLLSHVDASSYEDGEPFNHYWECVTSLLKRQCLNGRRLDTSLVNTVTYFLGQPQRRERLLYSMHSATLSKFLEIPNMCINIDYNSAWDSIIFNSLSKALSSVLVLRQRLHWQHSNPELVESLFVGSFMTNNFRLMITRQSYLDPVQRDQEIMTMAKHCARLSVDCMLRICDQLEIPRNDGRELGEQELALIARIRRGLMPGGELTSECDPACSCMPASPKFYAITRWLSSSVRGISAAFTSHV